MSDMHAALSTYESGTNDTYTSVVDNTDDVLAIHQNGPASAVVAIQTILGTGTTLKGSAADLVARLAIAHEADGKIKDFTSTTKTTFPPTTAEGCVGDVTANFTASELLRKHASLEKFETTGLTVGTSGVVSTVAGTETLTNKTLTTPTIGDQTNSQHNHTSAAQGGGLGADTVGVVEISTSTTGSFTTSSYSGDVGTSEAFLVAGTKLGEFTITPSDANRGNITITPYHPATTSTPQAGRYLLVDDGTGVLASGTVTVTWDLVQTV